MFRTLLILVAIFASLGGGVLAPSTAYADIETSLIGRWTFDGKNTVWSTLTAGTTADISGSGNNGVLTNMNRTTTPTPGKLGQALNFNSLDSYVDTNLTALANQRTYSAWIYPRSAGEGNFGTIFGKDGNFSISMCSGDATECTGASNTLEFYNYFSGTDGFWSTSNNSITFNAWNHVVVVYDNSSTANVPSIYINGQPASIADSQTPTGTRDSSASALFLGTFDTATQFVFDGRMDDMRVYNRLLTADDVLQLYRAGSALSKPSNNLGLVGYWPMNEATSTIAGDFSGQGNTGTLSGATTPSWVAGARGRALSFNGTTAWVDAGTSATLALTGAVTTCAWIKPSSISVSGDFIIARTDASINGPYMLYVVNSDELGFAWTDDLSTFETYTTTDNAVSLNLWQHVCATRVSNSEVHLYVNGVEHTATPSGNATPTTLTTTSRIGQSGAGDYFNGIIDEARIYSRALGASEIATLAQAGATRIGASSKTLAQGTTLSNGLTGHWTFDGGDVRWTSASAGVAYDRSGTGNTGTLTNMTQASSVALGKLGQALSFTSTEQVRVANPSTFNFGTADFSISMWVNPKQAGNDEWIFTKTNASNWDVSGKSILYLLDGIYFDAFGVGSAGNITAVPTNSWTHIVYTFTDSSNNLIAYKNGVQVDSDTLALTADGGSDVINIGSCCGAVGAFPGLIDDVRIYNRVLTPAEVKKLSQLGQVKIAQ